MISSLAVALHSSITCDNLRYFQINMLVMEPPLQIMALWNQPIQSRTLLRNTIAFRKRCQTTGRQLMKREQNLKRLEAQFLKRKLKSFNQRLIGKIPLSCKKKKLKLQSLLTKFQPIKQMIRTNLFQRQKSRQKKKKEEFEKKKKIIEKAGTEFFESMLDVADMDKLSQTIYRIFQLESVTDVCLTKDGGYVISGSRMESDTRHYLEAVLIKLNSLGQEQWSRVINYRGSDKIHSVAETENGDLVTAGNILPNYYVTFDDLWVHRMNSTGHDIWKYTYPYSDDGAHGVMYTSDGNILVVGAISDSARYKTRIWIVKMDEKKNIIWDLDLGWAKGGSSMENSMSYDARYSIETSDGHYLIVGFYNKYIWMVKVSPDGSIIFQAKNRNYGMAQEVREAPDGNYVVVASQTCGKVVGTDSIIVKMSKNSGSEIWMKKFHDNSGYFHFNLQCMEKLSDGFIFGGEKTYRDLNGWTQGMNWLVKTDFSGNVKWQRTFGGGIITRIRTATDGALVMTMNEGGGVSSFFKFYEKEGCT
eukprot:TRINITY_DN5312_c0_g1_i4.p1 TRINITY_DN5312_c0_g1~~TRINITY_DN5312_c0_g1_i4.p1  ORF type:complete len:531 (+),score=43.91 TRINITY_DN5312_c0_g1_i4:151-1743(+)